jgi:regulator of extracellular matrix RemA (YlzA/DUF370 family)
MDIKLVNIGFGNIVAANRIVAIVSPESAPIKRIIQIRGGQKNKNGLRHFIFYLHSTLNINFQ